MTRRCKGFCNMRGCVPTAPSTEPGAEPWETWLGGAGERLPSGVGETVARATGSVLKPGSCAGTGLTLCGLAVAGGDSSLVSTTRVGLQAARVELQALTCPGVFEFKMDMRSSRRLWIWDVMPVANVESAGSPRLSSFSSCASFRQPRNSERIVSIMLDCSSSNNSDARLGTLFKTSARGCESRSCRSSAISSAKARRLPELSRTAFEFWVSTSLPSTGVVFMLEPDSMQSGVWFELAFSTGSS
mmetsp:Transcript_45020/g.105020  ORF Transcript_45020/g.105020 Transcript_45020/m.105020 type:complete len:244 (-) Transcript_45020:2267-2998(-)